MRMSGLKKLIQSSQKIYNNANTWLLYTSYKLPHTPHAPHYYEYSCVNILNEIMRSLDSLDLYCLKPLFISLSRYCAMAGCITQFGSLANVY